MHRRPLKNPGTAQSGSGLGGCHHQFCHRKSDGHVISPSNHCQRGHFRCPEQKGSCSPPLGLLSLLCCSISQKKKKTHSPTSGEYVGGNSGKNLWSRFQRSFGSKSILCSDSCWTPHRPVLVIVTQVSPAKVKPLVLGLDLISSSLESTK